MWVADMEFGIPEIILDAIMKRLEHPILGYTTATEGLVSAVTGYLEQRHQWKIDADWLVWLPGVVPGLAALTRLLNPDDQIMVFTPVYHPLTILPEKYQRTRIDVPLKHYDGRWHIDFERFESEITRHCRMLFLCSPHNPMGTVFTEVELNQLTEICAANEILLVSDEIHCDLVLDSTRRHIPTGSVAPDKSSNLVTLMSPSKTFNLAGANCSFAIIPDAKLRENFIKTSQYTLPVVPTLSYTAAEAAYRHGWEWHNQLIEYLRGNLQLLCAFVHDTPYLSMDTPESTYLAWINTEAMPVADAHKTLLEAGVGLSPGAQFGDARYQRLNFACSRAQLSAALERMGAVL